MQIIRDIEALREAIAALRGAGGTIGLVPTMGALHAGHMALVAEAKLRTPNIVTSIFVNPTQFGPNEDLAAYPRREAADSAMLDQAGCAILWAPDTATMYPDGHSTRIRVGEVGEGLCDVGRPGHFEGVATIVAKLFNQVMPDFAVFGEKDYQQLAAIRRMVRDLDMQIEIVGVPTQRDADGVALSSRNAYLSESERRSARALPRSLGEAAAAIQNGADIMATLAAASEKLSKAGFDTVEYVELRDAETLARVNSLQRPARLLAAARIGTTRLIDNLPVAPAGQ